MSSASAICYKADLTAATQLVSIREGRPIGELADGDREGLEMVLNVNAATVAASAAAEGGVAADLAAATAVASAALTAVMPMGADLDSVQFAAAMNAAGASYIAAAGEHMANRGSFASSQNLAAATYTATEAINNAALAL